MVLGAEDMAPIKVSIKFGVSPEQLADALSMAEEEGLPEAEFHRFCWILGLNHYYDGVNKRLVNKRLRQRIDGQSAQSEKETDSSS